MAPCTAFAVAFAIGVPLAFAQGRATWSRVTPATGSFAGRGAQIGGFAGTTAVFAGGNQGPRDSTRPPFMTYDINTGIGTDLPDTTGWSRANMAAVATDAAGLVWTFGGLDVTTQAEVNTLGRFDPATRTWTNIAPATGAVVGTSWPPVSKQAVMVYLPACQGPSGQAGSECLLLYGGSVGSGTATVRFGDLWMYIPATNTWSRPAAAQSSASGGKAPVLANAAAVASPDGRAMYIFGGETAGGAVLNDIFVLDPQGTFWPTPQSAEMANLALSRPAFQSSTQQINAGVPATICSAGLATNGQAPIGLQNGFGQPCQIAATIFPSAGMFVPGTGNNIVTGGELFSWWYVDLGSEQAFDAIQVFTRPASDMGPGRFAGWQIWYGNSNVAPTLTAPPGNGANTRCNNLPVDIFGVSVAQPCVGRGRYVWIFLPPMATAGRFLFLSEVQVLQRVPWVWRKLTGIENVAQGKPVFASGTNTLFDPVNLCPVEYATDGIITNNWPQIAHTNAAPSDCNNVFIAVDLGDTYDLTQAAVWPRFACCLGRSLRFELYAGSSRDWRANQRVLMPAGQVFSIVASQPGFGTYWPGNCPPALGPGAAGTSCWVSNTLTVSGTTAPVRARYVHLRKTAFNPNNCADLNTIQDDRNTINIGEFQVWGQKMPDSPAPRSAMGYTSYRGSLVIAAGSDGTGLRLNDVRFFDMVRNRWWPAATPLGSSPLARTNPLLMPLPNINDSPNFNFPSDQLALVGGFDTSGQPIGDINILTFPSCRPIPMAITATVPATGIANEDCSGAGTACYYTCNPGFTPANDPTKPLVCQPDGTWSGRQPVCVLSTAPTAPLTVTVAPVPNPANASQNLPGQVLVQWQPPSFDGLWPVTAYRVSTAPVDFIETFTAAGLGPSWSAAPVDGLVSTSFWGFSAAEGALMMDNMEGAGTNNGAASAAPGYNGLNLLRTFPSAETGLSADGDWAVETQMWFDTTTIRTVQNDQVIGLCIYDFGIWRTFNPAGQNRRLGACQFFAGIRRSGNTWGYGWESLLSTGSNAFFVPGTGQQGWFNFWFNAPQPSAWIRIERNGTAGTWRCAFRFQAAGPWIYLPVVPNTDALLVNGTMTRPMSTWMRVGFITRTWSGNARLLAYAKYLRVTPLGACLETGSTRVVPRSATNATIVGLSADRPYTVRVQTVNVAGRLSAPSTPSSGTITVGGSTSSFFWNVSVPNMFTLRTLVDAVRTTPYQKITYAPSVWDGNVGANGPQVAIDGLSGNFAQAGRGGGFWNPAGAGRDLTLASSYTGTQYVGGVGNQIDPLGDWWAIDLRIRTAVKAIFIAGRNNGCCVGRTTNLEVYIGDFAPPYWNLTQQCDRGTWPQASLSNAASTFFDPGTNRNWPYAGHFPCSITGRYVYFRAPPSLGPGNANGDNRDGQYNFEEMTVYASNRCPARTPSNADAVIVNTPIPCNNPGYGDVCVHSCAPGFTAVRGSSVANCDGDNWDADPLVCAPVCPTLPAPPLMGRCLQTFATDDFSVATTLPNWFSANSLQPIGAKWFIADGALQATTRLGCFDQMFALFGSQKIAGYMGDFVLSTQVQVNEASQAGVVFLANAQGSSYARVMLDLDLGRIVVDRSINGVNFLITDLPFALFNNQWYTLAVSYVTATRRLNVTLDGTVVIQTSMFVPFTNGFAGLYAATNALFENFAYQAPCAGCSGALAGEVCAFTCQEGLVSVNPAAATRTCTAAGASAVAAWVADPVALPFSCRVPNPVFSPSTLVVSEATPRNGNVGQPLLGSTSSPDYQLQWSIVSETPSNPNIGPLFYVDICSGQVKLRQSGQLDFYAWTPTYTLLVRASIAGFSDSFTDRNITVTVLPVDTPPRLQPSTLTLPENPAAGSVVGVPTWSDREGSTVTWALTADGSGGAFVMDPATGQLTVSRTAGCVISNASSACLSADLDFEGQGGNTFTLTVTATQTSTCCNTPGPLASSTQITVQLTDVNDAPRVVPDQQMTVFDSAALVNTVVGVPRTTDADAGASPFASATMFDILSPAAQALVSACIPDTGASYPSTNGLFSDSRAVFVINPTTGALSLSPTLANIPAWAGITPFPAAGALVRRVYGVCVNASDSFGGWGVGLVTVIVEADTANTPVIRSWAWPPIGMSCLGGENILFTGSGFNAGIQVISATLVNSEGSSWRIPSCTRNSNATITCRSPEGVGAGVRWTLFADGTPILTTTPLVNNYRPPRLSGSWDTYANRIGTNGWFSSTVGALPVWLYTVDGTMPRNVAATNASIVIQYGLNYEFPCNFLASVYLGTAATSQYFSCATTPGVGARLPWRLCLAGQCTTDADYNKTCVGAGALLPNYYCTYLFGYMPPTISAVTAACSPAPCVPTFNRTVLDTAGGQSVIINGTNFGEARFPITVTFGGPAGDRTPITCLRAGGAATHTGMTCSTPPGAGVAHLMMVTLGGVTLPTLPTAFPFSYLPPRITRVYGAGSVGAKTEGGQTLLIEGLQLGPVSGPLAMAAGEGASYGPANDTARYRSNSCRVTSSPDSSVVSTWTMTCETSEGVGAGHSLSVRVGSQSSNTLARVMSYGAPQIASFAGVGAADADTMGGEEVRITGANFGPGTSNPAYASFFQPQMAVSYGVRLDNGPVPNITFVPAGCIVSIPHTELTCNTRPGAGRGLAWTITLAGLLSTVPTTSYKAPVIDDIVDAAGGAPVTAASPDGGLLIHVRGRFFGPFLANGLPLVQSVSYGPSGGELALPATAWNVSSQTLIVVRLPPGTGQNMRMQVSVADQLSEPSTATFSYAPPRIVAISPARARTASNPRQPTMVTLTTLNLPLRDRNSVIGVLFGNSPYAISITPELPVGEAAIRAATNPATGTVDIRFPLPAQGSGVGLGVRITVTSIGSSRPSYTSPVQYPDTGFTAVFSYNQPVIADVAVSRARFILPPIMQGMPGADNATEADGAVPCPFPYDAQTGNQQGAWRCIDPALRRLEIIGQDFGVFPDALPDSSVPPADRQDGVVKTLETLRLNDTFTGAVLWGTASIYLYSWSHTRIVAFSPLTEGTLRLTIASKQWDYVEGDPVKGLPAVQEVIQPFSSRNPEIGFITGGVANIASTGGDPSGAAGAMGVVALQVANLVSVQRLIIRVGPYTVPPTSIVNTDNNQLFASDAAVAAWLLGKSGLVNLRFIVPPGQGVRVPVQVVNQQTGGSSLGSNTGFTVSYAAPVIRRIATFSPAAPSTLVRGPLDAAARPVLLAPTDASLRLRIWGTNLGVAPVVGLGDNQRVAGAVECSAADAALAGIPARGGANGHTCYDVAIPAGEGSGSQYPLEYLTGFYPLYVETGTDSDPFSTDPTSQESAQAISFANEPPEIVSVTPLRAADGLPTEGGVPVLVRGRNFGVTRAGRAPTTLTVDFRGANGVGSFFPCLDVSRVDHYTLNCTLPEGSGLGLTVRVNVAEQEGVRDGVFSYSSPVVTNVSSDEVQESVAGLAWPRLRGNTRGMTTITLSGRNFGKNDPAVHCIFLTWANRAPGFTRACNGQEDYLGEGEVPADYILSWSHTQIVFSTLPGVGRKEVEVSIRGAGLATGGAAGVPQFWYSDPLIQSVLPGTVGTDGGEEVVITGVNFGPPPTLLNASLGSGFPLSLAANGALAFVGGLPTAYRLLTFHRTCISDALLTYGAPPTRTVPVPGLAAGVPITRCLTGTITSWSHNRIAIRSAPGIGVNRSVYVLIDEGGEFITSPPALISYRPPSIDVFSPNRVLIGIDAGASPLMIIGRDFGDATLAVAQGWTADELAVRGAVGGIDCVDPVRVQENGAAPRIRCPVAGNVPAGVRNVTIRVAGQTGFRDVVPAFQAILIGCRAGYYGRVNETCLPCPAQNAVPALTGADCAGLNDLIDDASQMHTYPKPRAGWYNLNSTDSWVVRSGYGGSMMEVCPPGRQDAGRDVCIVPCDPPESCLGDNLCEAGYASRAPMWRCASCDRGYYRRAGQCIKCPDSPAALFIGFALLVVVVAGVGFWLNKRQVNIAVISIGVDFFQVLAIFSQSRIKWPPVIKELLHVLSAFNLNIEIVAPECLIPDVSYRQKFWFIMLLPLCVFSLLVLMFLATAGYKAIIQGRPKKDWFAAKGTLVSSSLVLLYLLYLYLTRTIMDVFNCAPTVPSDGKTYLQVVFEECGVPGGTQLTLLGYAIAGLIVYTIGYPAFIGVSLFKNRFLVMQDQLLRAKGVGNDKLTNPNALGMRQTLGRSYFAFKPDFFWWSLVVIFRKFCIAITAVVFGRNSAFQMAACLLVMFLAYVAQVHARPYMSTGSFDEVLKAHNDASFTNPIHARLRAAVSHIESRGRKRTRKDLMDASGKINRNALFGALTGWLFDYNTIEAITQFSAVIVCLMGVMYEANSVSGATAYPGSTDSVTTVVLLVIITTIIYLAVTLITEIYVLAGDAKAESARAARARGKAKGKSLDGEGEGEGGRSSRHMVGDESSLNVGNLENQMNPMFMSKSGGASLSGGGEEGLESLFGDPSFSSNAPPPAELWMAFKAAYVEKANALSAAQELLLAARKAEEFRGSRAGGSAEEGEDTPKRTSRSPAVKASFAPVAGPSSSSSGSSKALGGKGGGMSLAAAKSSISRKAAQ